MVGGRATTARVGVLALQGASGPHRRVLAGLGVEAREVRSARDLDGLSHLVLPGGESTTIRHLLDLFGLAEPLVAAHRAGALVLLGSCAGAILLGRDDGTAPRRLGLLDAELRRNAYGRQTRSFVAPVAVEGLGSAVRGLFIRAPRVVATGPGVRVLAHHAGDPVVLEGPGVLAVTFHPELVGEDRLHRRFLSLAPAGARAAAALPEAAP